MERDKYNYKFFTKRFQIVIMVINMANFGNWVKDTFKKDPFKVSQGDIKRDQLKIDRLSSIKRDEIEDINAKMQKTIQKGVGQSRETKIFLSNELSALKVKKTQIQKAHESLMKQKKALNMLEFIVSQKNSQQMSTVAQNVFDADIDKVAEISNEIAIEGMMQDDKMTALEGALVGLYGEEQLSDDTEQALEMWDEIESGNIDEDAFFEEVGKIDDKLIIKRENESI